MKAFAKVTHNVKVALGVESIIVLKVFHLIAIAAHHLHVMQVFLSKKWFGARSKAEHQLITEEGGLQELKEYCRIPKNTEE